LKHKYYLNSNFLWLDNENLIYIAQKEGVNNLDGLINVKYNVKTGENIVLFEFNIDYKLPLNSTLNFVKMHLS